MEVGEKIRAYMHSHGITQAHISRQTGIPAAKLNLSLNGKRRFKFDEYESVCGALGVGVDCFLEPKMPHSTHTS